MGEGKVKPSLYVCTISDILKAHHLGIPVYVYLARMDELNRQYEQVKRGKSST